MLFQFCIIIRRISLGFEQIQSDKQFEEFTLASGYFSLLSDFLYIQQFIKTKI